MSSFLEQLIDTISGQLQWVLQICGIWKRNVASIKTGSKSGQYMSHTQSFRYMYVNLYLFIDDVFELFLDKHLNVKD